MTLMQQEIYEQIELLPKSVQKNQPTLVQIGKIAKQRNIQFVVYAARGSSDNAGVYFKYLLEVHAGKVVSFAAPSVITLYEGKPDFANTLVIGVSQSGKAKDVFAVLELAKTQGALTVSITNHTDSPLAQLADFHLDLAMGNEKSVAATKTFTAQLLLLAHLANYLSPKQPLHSDLEKVYSLMKETLNQDSHIQEIAKRFVSDDSVFVLGRGYSYGVADELALKLQETAYIKAMAFATSDFYHGPFALASKESKFIVLAPQDSSYQNSKEIIERIEELGAEVIVFSCSSQAKEPKITLPNAPQSIVVFPLILASQLLSLYISLAKGLHPDTPRGLKKVTITV